MRFPSPPRWRRALQRWPRRLPSPCGIRPICAHGETRRRTDGTGPMDFLRAFKPIVLDLLATIAFVAVLWLAKSVVAATLAGVAAGLARFLWLKLRGRPVGPLQYVSVVLVIVSGTATLITSDVHFMQIK